MESSGDFNMAKHLNSFAAYRHMVGAALDSNSDAAALDITSGSKSDVETGDAHQFWAKAQTCHNRRLFYTEGGRLGLGTLFTQPIFTQPKDVCSIFFGIPVPVLLREAMDGNYRLLGDSYTHGVMGGELIELLRKGQFKDKQLTHI